MTSLEVLRERHPHGTRVRYMTGCKCMLCRAANSRYETERAAARKNGDWNGIVSAEPARLHLKKLQAAGIGRRLIAEIIGCNDARILEIRNGRKQFIRSRTLRAILSVTEEARGDKTLVEAAPVWARINLLLRHGFTKAEIARRIGLRSPAIQFRSHVVTARNAMRIEKLCRTVFAGDPEVQAKTMRLRSIPQRMPR